MLLVIVMLPWFAHATASAASADEQVKSSSAAGGAVYIVHAKQTVEAGLESFLERAYREADEAHAERIVLVLNTFGGRVDSAMDIGELIRTSKVPTTIFVEGKAVSAGTYIALNAEQIVMQPGSTIGAAAVVNGSGELIDNPKTISFWTGEMVEAARLHGRNPDYAAAMTDVNAAIDLKEIGRKKASGDILTLTTTEAEKAGYADHVAANVQETIKWLGLEGRTQIEVTTTWAENLAAWLTSPIIVTLLLILGIAGIAIEMMIPGFGIPGIVGLVSFVLFFFGHYVAGFAGQESILLFVLGLALLVSELFIPSFGILGILGAISLISGVVTASHDALTALYALLIALVVAAIIVYVMAKKFGHRGIWNKFILRDKLTTEQGYVSAPSRESLIGRTGVTLSPLRPAGTVDIDGERLDVVTDGRFIGAGVPVVVVTAEGARIVVKEVRSTNNE
ncbi:nodulation protein NfeD [Paenibacillus sp. PR3]|uniref:Nodulation protein NfeD n=2 Tax=Paenibacillus terricola TaxID=2763503 RepID=A0ABR8MTV2_9BACL|nr:nodulation protein NfeD [Paenibacillus terricola]